MSSGRRFSLALVCCLLSLTLGCEGDDTGPKPDVISDSGEPDTTPPPGCELRIATINGEQPGSINRIDPTLDQDAATDGVQLDVEVVIIGKPDGTEITLDVTDLRTSPKARSAGNKALFEGVTVDPAKTPVVTFEPRATGCQGRPLSFNALARPACSFISPPDGALLFDKDDKIPGNASFDFDVLVQTENAGLNARVSLEVEGTEVSAGEAPDAFGVARFLGIAFPPTPTKQVTLEAHVTFGDLEGSCNVTFTVDFDAPSCVLGDFDPPPKTTTIGEGFGVDQDADPNTEGMQTSVTVTTGADSVELLVNGIPVFMNTVAPTDGKAVFNIDLAEGTSTLQAICTDTTTLNSSQSNQANAVVDTIAPPPVSTLACSVTHNRAGQITCTFAPPDDGPDGSGVEKCLLHHREDSDIDAGNFDEADTVKATHPVAGGSATLVTAGLKMPHVYDFAVKCLDYLGNVSPISNAVDAMKIDFVVDQLEGQFANASFGLPIAPGDFNCDGLTDMAVGVGQAANDAGEVQLFFSNGASFSASFDTKIRGKTSGGFFGSSLTALDFNNDGCKDLAVMAAGNGKGKYFLFLGNPVWDERTDEGDPLTVGAEVVFELASGAGASDQLGVRVSHADFDGDGYDDILATYWLTDASAMVLINYGDPAVPYAVVGTSPEIRFMPLQADVQIVGGSSAHKFGWPVASAGKVTPDDYEDVLISAVLETAGGASNAGAVYFVEGGTRSSSPEPEIIDILSTARVHRIEGSSEFSFFGAAITGVGDTNGDGESEFAITSGDATNMGQVHLFDLSTGFPASVSDARAVIKNDLYGADDDSFGYAIARGAEIHPTKGADLNNDGFSDFVVSMLNTGTTEKGSAKGFFGAAGPLKDESVSSADLSFFAPTDGGDSFGVEVNILPDVNGDGYQDVVIGETTWNNGVGRILLYR